MRDQERRRQQEADDDRFGDISSQITEFEHGDENLKAPTSTLSKNNA